MSAQFMQGVRVRGPVNQASSSCLPGKCSPGGGSIRQRSGSPQIQRDGWRGGGEREIVSRVTDLCS